ncbi:MAG: hypothetical protein L3J96_06045, partial [Thermoplasmata archaeon]|nr:hypothetical protein [Thermoplasmata archaeon]
AKLMAEVRAALSEDRRYGTPEEEIEALWTEVDRLTKERQAGELAQVASDSAVASPLAESANIEEPILSPSLEEPEATIAPEVPILSVVEPPMSPPDDAVVDPPVETRRRSRGARAVRP